jgi:TIR domain
MSQLSQEDRPKTKIFVSYAPKDREIVERISRTLEKDANILVFKDTEDILPTEEWRNRLESLISSADTIVFCISPDSGRRRTARSRNRDAACADGWGNAS